MASPPARSFALTAESPVSFGQAGSTLAHAAVFGLLALLPQPDLTRFELPEPPELNVVMVELPPPLEPPPPPLEFAALPPQPPPTPPPRVERPPPPPPPVRTDARPAEAIPIPDDAIFEPQTPNMVVEPPPDAIAAPAAARTQETLRAAAAPGRLADEAPIPDLTATDFAPVPIDVAAPAASTVQSTLGPNLEREAAPQQSASVDFRRLGPTAEERAEEDARRRAEAERLKLQEGGKEAPAAAPPAGGGGPGSTVRAVIGGAPPAISGGGGPAGAAGSGAFKGVFGPEPGCENPDAPGLSEDQRARCLRAKWAAARGAGALGPVRASDQRGFDAAAAARNRPREDTVISCGDNTGAECLPSAAPER